LSPRGALLVFFLLQLPHPCFFFLKFIGGQFRRDSMEFSAEGLEPLQIHHWLRLDPKHIIFNLIRCCINIFNLKN